MSALPEWMSPPHGIVDSYQYQGPCDCHAALCCNRTSQAHRTAIRQFLLMTRNTTGTNSHATATGPDPAPEGISDSWNRPRQLVLFRHTKVVSPDFVDTCDSFVNILIGEAEVNGQADDLASDFVGDRA